MDESDERGDAMSVRTALDRASQEILRLLCFHKTLRFAFGPLVIHLTSDK